MNSAILLIAGRFRRLGGRRLAGRVLLAAAAGSTIESAVLLFTKKVIVYEASAICVAIPVMVRLVFGRKKLHQWGADLALCLGIAVMLGGAMSVVEVRMGQSRTSVLAVLASVLFAELLLGWLYQMYRLQRRLLPVTLYCGDRSVRCQGLWDTGNLLHLPESGEPVHITSAEILRQLGLSEEEAFDLVLFESLGQSEGVLPVYRIDRLSVEQSGLHKREENAVNTNRRRETSGGSTENTSKRRADLRTTDGVILACADSVLFAGKFYQIILNGEVLRF